MRAKFNTAKSIYKALEIEVDDKVYVCKKITKDFLDKFIEIGETVNPTETKDGDNVVTTDGDKEAPYKQVNFAFGVPLKVLYKLDSPEIRDINHLIITAMSDAEKIEAAGEKDPNLERPGGSS